MDFTLNKNNNNIETPTIMATALKIPFEIVFESIFVLFILKT